MPVRVMLPLLRLQQLADSAFPIGSAAHSFGIETLVEAGLLTTESLAAFLQDYLEETGTLEASYCAASCGCQSLDQWLEWNAELGARKLARESRDGSAAMGGDFCGWPRIFRATKSCSERLLLARRSIWRPASAWLRASSVSSLQPLPQLICSNR